MGSSAPRDFAEPFSRYLSYSATTLAGPQAACAGASGHKEAVVSAAAPATLRREPPLMVIADLPARDIRDSCPIGPPRQSGFRLKARVHSTHHISPRTPNEMDKHSSIRFATFWRRGGPRGEERRMERPASPLHDPAQADAGKRGHLPGYTARWDATALLLLVHIASQEPFPRVILE